MKQRKSMLVRATLEDITTWDDKNPPPKIENLLPEYGYQVLGIRTGEYYWYIKESNPKQNTKRAEYRNAYLRPSFEPKIE